MPLQTWIARFFCKKKNDATDEAEREIFVKNWVFVIAAMELRNLCELHGRFCSETEVRYSGGLEVVGIGLMESLTTYEL